MRGHPLEQPMKQLWVRLVLALLAAAAAHAESFSARQCPNFATTEQPYLYLYTEDEYAGEPLYITNASVPDLGEVQLGKTRSSLFNDKASSLRARGKWRICTETAYGGKCLDISSKDWKSELMIGSLKDKLGAEFEDSISSLKLLSCSQH